jgi:hypothetical protein
MFLEDNGHWMRAGKKLIIWINNRFDYHAIAPVAETVPGVAAADLVFPDSAFYNMYRDAAGGFGGRVAVIGYTPWETVYGRTLKGMNWPDVVIKPSGMGPFVTFKQPQPPQAQQQQPQPTSAEWTTQLPPNVVAALGGAHGLIESVYAMKDGKE